METGEPAADRFAAIHGLFWLCANRTDRNPIVVAVDDAHWVDEPSLAWLGYLARRAADLPLLLVLSCAGASRVVSALSSSGSRAMIACSGSRLRR